MAYQKYKEMALSNGIQVRHLNGESLDNSYHNISIGTQSENQMDIPSQIRYDRSSRAGSAASPHNWAEIDEYRNAGASYGDILKRYGVPKGTLSYRYGKRHVV
jgi:hypothetical protein